MTVRDNIAFGLKIRKRPKDEIDERVDELLDARAARRAGPTATRRSSPAASASAWRWPARSRSSPRCCCSTSRSARSTRACARSCASGCAACTRRSHVTTIFVTHDQEEAMEVAEQIVVVNEGRIEQAGSPAEVYEKPANDVRHGVRRAGDPAGRPTVRPHDLEIAHRGGRGALEAMVSGSCASASRCASSCCPPRARCSRPAHACEADELELTDGDIVWVRGRRRPVEQQQACRGVAHNCSRARLRESRLCPASGHRAGRRSEDQRPVKGERVATGQDDPAAVHGEHPRAAAPGGIVASRRGAEGGYLLGPAAGGDHARRRHPRGRRPARQHRRAAAGTALLRGVGGADARRLGRRARVDALGAREGDARGRGGGELPGHVREMLADEDAWVSDLPQPRGA